MRSLSAQVGDLRPGDVITSTTTDPGSAIIRLGTMSDASHAMIYLGNNRIVEAVPPTVRVTLVFTALDDSPWANAWTIDSLSTQDRKKICDFAIAQRGAPYSPMAAVFSAVGMAAGDSPSCFCSRLCAAAYDSVGVALTNQGWGATYPGLIEKRESRNASLRWLGWLKNPLLGDGDPRFNVK